MTLAGAWGLGAPLVMVAIWHVSGLSGAMGMRSSIAVMLLLGGCAHSGDLVHDEQTAVHLSQQTCRPQERVPPKTAAESSSNGYWVIFWGVQEGFFAVRKMDAKVFCNNVTYLVGDTVHDGEVRVIDPPNSN